MDKLHLKRTLTELAETGVPDGVDVWPRVQARVAPRPPDAWPWLRLRAGWAGLALAGLLLLGATAYAASARPWAT